MATLTTETQTANLASLPSEILVKILHTLDWRDLVVCYAISKPFYKLIQDTKSLQYQLSLAVHGLADNCAAANSISASALERLDILAEHQRQWRSLNWEERETISLNTYAAYELYGGVFAQQCNSRRGIEFTKLSSGTGKPGTVEWAHEDMGFVAMDFAIDPSQDLLIAAEDQSPTLQELYDVSYTYRTHIRRLCTDAPHPLAQMPILRRQLKSLGPAWPCNIQICGPIVGIYYKCRDEGLPGEICVWNWQENVLHCVLATQPREPAKSFAFLSRDAFVLPTLTETAMTPALAVYSAQAEPDESAPTPILLAMYELPQIDSEYSCSGIWCRADPSPYPPPETRLPHSTDGPDTNPFLPSKPFFPDASNQLVSFDFTFHNGLCRARFMLFVLSQTLLRHNTETKDRVVEWADWGPSNTRLVQDVASPSTWLVCYTHGFKYAYLSERVEADPSEQWLHIMDFNPSNRFSAEVDSVSCQNPASELDGFESSMITDAGGSEYGVISYGLFVQAPIVTGLPYLETRRKLSSERSSILAVMIDLERVVLPKGDLHDTSVDLQVFVVS